MEKFLFYFLFSSNFLWRFLGIERALGCIVFNFYFYFWFYDGWRIRRWRQRQSRRLRTLRRRKRKRKRFAVSLFELYSFRHFILSWLEIANVYFATFMIRLVDVMSEWHCFVILILKMISLSFLSIFSYNMRIFVHILGSFFNQSCWVHFNFCIFSLVWFSSLQVAVVSLEFHRIPTLFWIRIWIKEVVSENKRKINKVFDKVLD